MGFKLFKAILVVFCLVLSLNYVFALEGEYCPADGSLNPYFLLKNSTTDIFKVDHGSGVWFYQYPTCTLKTDGDGKLTCGSDIDSDVSRWSLNTTVLRNESGNLGLVMSGLRVTESQVTDADWWDSIADITDDGITDTELLYNTGQHLMTGSVVEHQALRLNGAIDVLNLSGTAANILLTGSIKNYVDKNHYLSFTSSGTIQFLNSKAAISYVETGTKIVFNDNSNDMNIYMETDGVIDAFFLNSSANALILNVPLSLSDNTISGVTTLDTGQGANELFDMDQNVLKASNVTFDEATITKNITVSGKIKFSLGDNICMFVNGTDLVIANNLTGVTC